MRHIFLVGFLILSSITSAQKQTYGDFRAKTDKFFQDEFKKDPDNESLLKEYKYYQRFTWFWDTRVDSRGLSDSYFLELNNFITNKNQIQASIPYSTESLFGSNFWEIIGPNEEPADPYNRIEKNNIGIGRIDAIWVDPNNVDHLLIGAFGGGLWETLDGGLNWIHKTEGLNALTVSQIEVIDGVIYLACGFDFGSAKNFSNVHFGNKHGLGVIRSTDWGNSWVISNQKINAKAFTYHKSTPQIMYTVSDEAIYKSTNGGVTWLKKQDIFDHEWGTSARFNDIIAHPTNTLIAYAVGKSGRSGESMVYKTEDGGENWFSIQHIFNELTGLEGASNYKVKGGSFDYNPVTNKLYLAFSYGTDYDNAIRRSFIFESSDWATANWQIIAGTAANNKPTAFAGYTGIKIHPTNSNIYQLGINLYQRNSGNGTNISNSKIHDDMRAMAFSPDGSTMFVGHDGGISKSTNNGTTWININGNLNLNLSFEMGYYSDLNNRYYDIGTQDCGWYRKDMMNEDPRFATRRHEGSVYTSPHTGRIYFKHGEYGVEISDNGSSTMPIQIKWETNNVWQPEWESPLIEDPVDKNTVYLSYIKKIEGDLFWDSLFLVKNNANLSPNSWANKTPPVYSAQRGAAIHIPHSNNNVLYYVTVPHWTITPMDNIIWKSEDQGETWCNITNNLTSYFQGTHLRITHINADSYNPDKVWITVGGISDDGAHVFYSSNGGQSWTNITYNLPNLPVNVVEYDENRKILFIGTDYGVYYLDGITWKEYGNDLPKAIVTSLFIDDLYNEILVSIFGRGAWRAPLDTCSDVVIYNDTTWSSNKKFCGDLTVKAGKTLTINSSNVTVRNIIIEPGAKIIWNGGTLNFSESGLGVGKGVCALYNGSLLQLNNVTVKNYNIEARQESTVSLNIVSFNSATLNSNPQSFFHFIQGSTVNLDPASNINLHEGFTFGFHSSLSLSTSYVRNYANIVMSGLGSINGYGNDLYIQNQTFSSGIYNFYANHNIITGIDMSGGSSLTPGLTVKNNVVMKLEAGESILFDKGSEIKNTDFLAHINPDLAIPPVCNESLPLSSFTKENNYKESEDIISKNQKFVKFINIYPNPSSGIFMYELNSIFAEHTIRVFDMSGNRVFELRSNKSEGEINLSKYKAGTYALVLEIDGKTEKTLLVKK